MMKTQQRNNMLDQSRPRISSDHAPHRKTPGWGQEVCYWNESNHQNTRRMNNYRNKECPLSTRLQKSTGAHPWVKMLSMGHSGPCWGQMDRVWRNSHRWGTHYLVLRRRLETPVWGGIHCVERSEGSIIICTPISSRPISVQISARPHNII